MSGRPNIEQINDLRHKVSVFAEAKKKRNLAGVNIKLWTNRLKEADDCYKKAKKEIFHLMEQMDVSKSGNFGWEDRFIAFLSELMHPMGPVYATGDDDEVLPETKAEC